jgi:hypothetical protein
MPAGVPARRGAGQVLGYHAWKTSPPPTPNVIAINDGALLIRRRPGRPREVRPAVVHDFDERAYIDQLAKTAEDFISADPVLVASSDPGTTEVTCIEVIMRSVGEEQAALLHDRLRLQRENRDGQAQVARAGPS